MHKQIAMQWVAALRSNKYKQGVTQLRKGDVFDCLGILCNLHAQAHPEDATAKWDGEDYMGTELFLSNEVRDWAGMANNIAMLASRKLLPGGHTSLMHANNAGVSFLGIAELIEAHYAEL